MIFLKHLSFQKNSRSKSIDGNYNVDKSNNININSNGNNKDYIPTNQRYSHMPQTLNNVKLPIPVQVNNSEKKDEEEEDVFKPSKPRLTHLNFARLLPDTVFEPKNQNK